MKAEDFFGKDLNKALNKSRKSHASFEDNNKVMKREFKKTFNAKTLQKITEIVDEAGAFDHEKDQLKNFVKKVNAGNFDDSDVDIFKEVIRPYMDRISEELWICKSERSEKMTES
uniref:hypothetical protein n=1 Tax=Roseburia sp. TaxID=2049040 RepID=UPI003FEEC397